MEPLLTDTDRNLIVEALLFGACLEITDNWTESDRDRLIQLALQFKNELTTLDNIEYHAVQEETSTPSSVLSLFPNLKIIDWTNNI